MHIYTFTTRVIHILGAGSGSAEYESGFRGNFVFGAHEAQQWFDVRRRGCTVTVCHEGTGACRCNVTIIHDLPLCFWFRSAADRMECPVARKGHLFSLVTLLDHQSNKHFQSCTADSFIYSSRNRSLLMLFICQQKQVNQLYPQRRRKPNQSR